MALEPDARLSLGVPVAALLQSWNFACYNNTGPQLNAEHVAQIERVVNKHVADLRQFRARFIGSLASSDEPMVVRVFTGLERVVQCVGAAKALHLLGARFLSTLG